MIGQARGPHPPPGDTALERLGVHAQDVGRAAACERGRLEQQGLGASTLAHLEHGRTRPRRRDKGHELRREVRRDDDGLLHEPARRERTGTLKQVDVGVLDAPGAEPELGEARGRLVGRQVHGVRAHVDGRGLQLVETGPPSRG